MSWDIDDELVDGASRGEQGAVELLCARLLPLARAKVLFALGRHPGHFHVADDITQDVMTAFVRGLPRLRIAGAGAALNYVHQTVYQRVQSHWRSSYRALPRAEDLRRAGEALGDTSTRISLGAAVAHPTRGPATRAVDAEDLANVFAAAGSLPDTYRETLELAFVEGLSTAEIATRLGITRANAAMRLNRGLKALRRRMNGDDPAGEEASGVE